MNLTQIVIFGVLSAGCGVLFMWANTRANTQVRPYVGGQAAAAAKAVSGSAVVTNVRGWAMLLASVVAIYWLQSSTPIRYLDFWLPTASLGLTLLKAAAFAALMFFGGVRLIPWLLERTALTRSRELFVLAILAITLGIAMGASELFGVSLALGAFVAGAIISQSRLSHQVGADVFAFREIFSVLFFVSVGMLVNPLFLWQNLGHVVWLTLLVVAGKFIIVLLMGLFFPRPARTFLFGFSQGAALASLVALMHPDRVRKVGMLAGFVPRGAEGLAAGTPLSGKSIFVAHGTLDTMVPVERARASIRLLEQAGAEVIYCEEEVGHKVSAGCLRALHSYLAS